MKKIVTASVVTFLLLAALCYRGYNETTCWLTIRGSGYDWYYSTFEGCKFVKPDGRRFPLKVMREMNS